MSTQPVILTTWKFGLTAAQRGWELLRKGTPALDAIEAAANVTELDPEVTSVGYGGLPNAEGVVELDAAIMDGPTHTAGAVGALTGFRRPISVARRVMQQTPHVMLVGANARRFALDAGFPEEDLLTPNAYERWKLWLKEQHGPEVAHFDRTAGKHEFTPDNHDTIGLVAMDANGDLAVGCTTSGMAWKVPGRVGDSPIIGSGLYVDNAVGGAAGTGHGDEMMKACVSYRVVQNMAHGMTAQEACIESLRYLLKKRPPTQTRAYGAALIAIRKDGQLGAAATRSGFHAPDRLWQWAIGGEETTLHEGVYVTEESILLTLL